ncbi:MAG TPA: F0F1 ATP synthase subunit delta [Steroidobacteraceae bacterium]|nr:F0F1 ATP synthase subunit delta [Steroidobacteraceae bacterium]
MLIDWFTVAAQALNFIILIWLLRRYLYGPILAAVAAREKRIAAQLADAAATRLQARKEQEEFAQKKAQLERERTTLLDKAAGEANVERQRLLSEARRDADALSTQRRDALVEEARALDEVLRRRTQQEVFAIARRALQDLAAVSLEERITAMFVERLRSADAQAKERWKGNLHAAPVRALVRSAFELSASQRAAIKDALEEVVGAAMSVEFETAASLISGIEATVNEYRMAWSIESYLDALEREVGERIQRAGAGETMPS